MKILVAIPCYNEAPSLRRLISEIHRSLACDVLVVDDASTDNSYAIASTEAKCVRHVVNLGIGGAVQTGLKYAFENNYDLCIQVDGDGQHPPSQLPLLVNSYRMNPANLIIGSRFISNDGFRSTLFRRMGSETICRLLKLLFRKSITDPTSGFRLMDRDAIEYFSKTYPTDFPEPISIALALGRKMSVREIPVLMEERKHGKSSIMGLKTVSYMLRVLGYIVLTRLNPETV